jgi:hypothetical protein
MNDDSDLVKISKITTVIFLLAYIYRSTVSQLRPHEYEALPSSRFDLRIR